MRRTESWIALALCAGMAACTAENQGDAKPAARAAEATTSAAPMVAVPDPEAAAARTAADRDSAPAPTAANARQVVMDYYAALNAHDHKKAYALWGADGAASGQRFEHFSGGYANTESVEAEVGAATDESGAAGSRYISVPVELRAHQYNGVVRSYRGRFALRAVVAEGASEEQRRWHLDSAEMQRLADP